MIDKDQRITIKRSQSSIYRWRIAFEKIYINAIRDGSMAEIMKNMQKAKNGLLNAFYHYNKNNQMKKSYSDV